jgi:hypothetical protein
MSGRIQRPSAATVIAMAALFVALSGSSFAAIKANTIGSKQIKANGVGASEIADGTVGSAELGDNSVGGSEVANGAIGSGDVQDGSLTGDDVQDESLTTADVQDGSLGTGDVQNESLGSVDIQDGSLGTADVQNESLGSADVQDGSLLGRDVQDNGIGSAQVAGLDENDVVPGTFLGGSITVQFTQAAADLAAGAETSVDVQCPAGQIALGGGARGDLTNSEVTKITSTRPIISSSNSGAPADGGTFTGWRATVIHEAGSTATGIRPEVWVICAATP